VRLRDLALKYPLTATFFLLPLAGMVVGMIFCPHAPYHPEGKAFVGEMGHPGTAMQYHLWRFVVCTIVLSCILAFPSMFYESYRASSGSSKGRR
jgi:hypothetical protein